MVSKRAFVLRLVLGAGLVLAGFVGREAMGPQDAVAQVTAEEEEQLGSYEVTYAGNDGVWNTERFDRSLYSVEGGALVISNPFSGQLFKAYASDAWISVREITP